MGMGWGRFFWEDGAGFSGNGMGQVYYREVYSYYCDLKMSQQYSSFRLGF